MDDSDLEPNEARLDWLRTGAGSSHVDEVKAEVEHAFGLMTVELEVPYERDAGDGQVLQGVGNIDVGARYPFYQYVSSDEKFDMTFGAGIELGIPTYSSVSKNTELVPKLFNDLRIGDHFTLQSIAGYSTLFGGGEDGGLQMFEYGFVFGYAIEHQQLPVPGVQQIIPMAELIGETQMNKDNPGQNGLTADAGLRFNLKAIGQVQPRLGLGFVFPVNEIACQDLHWGIVTSLVFQY